MLIRHFEASDKDVFIELCKQFYTSEVTIRAYDHDITLKTFARIMDKHENSWGILLIDKLTEVAIGYALLTSYWSNEDGGNVIILDELYVCPTERHKGYGQYFMQWIENAFMDDAVSITLEVLTTNVKACDLYNRMGYKPDGYTTYTKPIPKKQT